MSANDGGTAAPQSMRQRRILDVATENPTASVAELASMVSSATPELVEQVLDRHGDPSAADTPTAPAEGGEPPTTAPDGAPDPSDTSAHNADSVAAASPGPDETAAKATAAETTTETDPTDDDYPTADDLSEFQRDVLAAIAARPTAIQRELAEAFEVSTSTVNTRVNSIPGFEWQARESFVEHLFDDRPSPDDESSSPDDDSAGIGQPTADDEAADTSRTVAADGSMDTANREAPDESPATTAEPTAEPTAAPTDTEALAEAVSALQGDVERLTTRLSALDAGRSDDGVFQDPALVHKVVHACLTSEAISEAEELRILEALLQ